MIHDSKSELQHEFEIFKNFQKFWNSIDSIKNFIK